MVKVLNKTDGKPVHSGNVKNSCVQTCSTRKAMQSLSILYLPAFFNIYTGLIGLPGNQARNTIWNTLHLSSSQESQGIHLFNSIHLNATCEITSHRPKDKTNIKIYLETVLLQQGNVKTYKISMLWYKENVNIWGSWGHYSKNYHMISVF